MTFPSDVREKVFVACGRHCCICHKFCGIKIELHHIKLRNEGGEDTFENCIPLCFDCHADMRSYDYKHPKGTKYTPHELKQHRDAWYTKVQQNSALLTQGEYVELDRMVFREVTQILPWDGVIMFMRLHHFGTSFHYEDIQAIEKFQWKCEDPSFEFIDADLEAARANLLESIQQFAKAFVFNVYPSNHPNSDKLSVPEKREWDNEEEYDQAVKVLNEASSKIAECYDALVKLARRKLAIHRTE